MNDNTMAANNRARLQRTLANRLTSAAYPIAARHGMKLVWVDLGIHLWTALDKKIAALERELAGAGWPVDFEIWRDRLASELTDAAYRIAWQYGALGSFLEGLHYAFCQVVKEIGRERILGLVLEVGLRPTAT